MRNAVIIAITLFICSCGDNIRSLDYPPDPPAPDARQFDLPGDLPEFVEVEPDAGVIEPDASVYEDSAARCCHALTTGGEVPHECGVPDGICKNIEKHELFCGEYTFVLCNPLF